MNYTWGCVGLFLQLRRDLSLSLSLSGVPRMVRLRPLDFHLAIALRTSKKYRRKEQNNKDFLNKKKTTNKQRTITMQNDHKRACNSVF